MNRFRNNLHGFVKNPRVQLWVGILLLAYSLVSIFTAYLGLHHGVFGVLVWQVWCVVPEILQALERIDKGAEDD